MFKKKSKKKKKKKDGNFQKKQKNNIKTRKILCFFLRSLFFNSRKAFFLVSFPLTRICIPFSYLFLFWQEFVSLPLIFLSFDESLYLFLLSFCLLTRVCIPSSSLFLFWREFESLFLIFFSFDEVLYSFLLSFCLSKDTRVCIPSSCLFEVLLSLPLVFSRFILVVFREFTLVSFDEICILASSLLKKYEGLLSLPRKKGILSLFRIF